MLSRATSLMVACLGVAILAGCSSSDAARIGLNLKKKDSNLRIFLDGSEAKQSKLKKGLHGYAPFTIEKDASTSPTFRYEIIEPKEFGFIKSVNMQVHQKFEADFSDIADYVIFARKQDSQAQMKPNVNYDLGNLGPDFKILDRHDKEVTKVEFKPGVEYLLVFTVQADKSESVQVYFKTK